MEYINRDKCEELIMAAMPFEPTESQGMAIGSMADFMASTEEKPTLVVCGYAGTGKTSLMRAFCDAAQQAGFSMTLMAPTGRAAKVLANTTGRDAHTIHRTIYRQETAGEFNSSFELNYNRKKKTIFIVDEASMISDSEQGDFGFGSGRLLFDLISYVFSRDDCRLLLVGDPAQLPPIGQTEAPALDADILTGYGIEPQIVWLTDVVRQAEESAILQNATRIRTLIEEEPDFFGIPKLVAPSHSDVIRISGEELIETLTSEIDDCGTDGVLVVTRSNQRAKQYNMGIRNMILGRESNLERGDMVIVSKNNYKWLGDRSKDFIANGDIAEIKRIKKEREMFGLNFAEVTLRLREHDNAEIDATIMMDFLTSDAASLTREQEEILYEAIANDYGDLGSKQKLFSAMKNDPWYNALRVKYAYAITCHKAQGGQWDTIFLDLGFITEDMMDIAFLKWLYTAMTRATKKLYLVNFSEQFFD